MAALTTVETMILNPFENPQKLDDQYIKELIIIDINATISAGFDFFTCGINSPINIAYKAIPILVLMISGKLVAKNIPSQVPAFHEVNEIVLSPKIKYLDSFSSFCSTLTAKVSSVIPNDNKAPYSFVVLDSILCDNVADIRKCRKFSRKVVITISPNEVPNTNKFIPINWLAPA